MDTQVSELIDRIKAEGVEQAGKQADQIVASAEEKAQAILARARDEAGRITDEAKRERAKQEAAGKEAVRQAARDTVLTVQGELNAIFKAVVEQAVGESMNLSVLEKAVLGVVSSWSGGESAAIDVVISDNDLSQIEKGLRDKLVEKLGTGVEIKGSSAISGGFHISSRDTGVYYDFSADAIADALATYVTPRLAETIREAAKDA